MVLKVAVCLSVLVITATATLFDSKGSFCCNPPKTFDAKIERILDYNDNDGDDVMTPKDLDRDLILYDTNGDCSVSPYEWVSVWSCRYGDTPDKAYEIFNMISGGAPSISFDTLRASARNSTREQFKTTVLAFYPENAQTGSQGR